MSDYLVTEEVAERVRVPPSTVRFWRHKGTGPKGFRVGRRVLYLESDVQAWIDEQAAAQQSGPGAA